MYRKLQVKSSSDQKWPKYLILIDAEGYETRKESYPETAADYVKQIYFEVLDAISYVIKERFN